MAIDYTLPKYDEQRNWIKKARDRGFPWERIQYGNSESIEDLVSFLESNRTNNFWDISIDDWKELVKSQREGEEKKKKISFSEKSSIISNVGENNDITIPYDEASCWQKYKRYLLDEQHFGFDDVEAIEESSLRVLQRLNGDTKGTSIKGMVIGNVQSGKTANMSALMSMAADYGWNMFIVLSGTIENLRLQTQERMINDLSRDDCNVTWHGLPRLSKKCEIISKTQSLHFNKGNRMRYLTVCLKNSSRLNNLIQWLHEDAKAAEQMKILIIDDEADQAGVNTKDISKDERTRINELIINLVGNKDADGKKTKTLFKAMNYIGYTATPYANVLNEAKEESLYPHDFISTLKVSKQYFGPQQIFGDRVSNNYRGLDIVRTIDYNDLAIIQETHGGNTIIPQSLQDSICWFLCCAATFRVWGYKKPISMLVHTSQKQIHHDALYNAVTHWLNNNKNSIIDLCKIVWERETSNFGKDDLFEGYPDFEKEYDDVKDYPKFYSLIEDIQILVNNITNIKLGDEGDFSYGKGIHLCVDNCKNNTVDDDGTYLRLAYPDSNTNLDYSPAFIVIGGATLSRGLTIEGLVSTYFLRSTKQADTLMQMGRWFGYRRGYELLQRLWITQNAEHQFQFLADLDSELRENISTMEKFNKKPRDYAVIIKDSPSSNFIRVTSKNKMHGAVKTNLNFSGSHNQTHLFVEDDTVLKDNYAITENFINSLGVADFAKTSYVWRNVDFDYIYENLLSKYTFHDKLVAFGEIDSIKSWVNKSTEEGKLDTWNVILFGINKGNPAEFNNCNINKVSRTRRGERDKTINIGVLTDPKEVIADIDTNSIDDELKEKLSDFQTRDTDIFREAAGLDKTPYVAIYVIDKNSKAVKKEGEESNRHDLNTKTDVIGLSMRIPGSKYNKAYAESIMIDLQRFGFGCDVEEEEYED